MNPIEFTDEFLYVDGETAVVCAPLNFLSNVHADCESIVISSVNSKQTIRGDFRNKLKNAALRRHQASTRRRKRDEEHRYGPEPVHRVQKPEPKAKKEDLHEPKRRKKEPSEPEKWIDKVD